MNKIFKERIISLYKLKHTITFAFFVISSEAQSKLYTYENPWSKPVKINKLDLNPNWLQTAKIKISIKKIHSAHSEKW